MPLAVMQEIRKMIDNKKIFLSLTIFLTTFLTSYFPLCCQVDTTIDGKYYEIVKRFENGKVKTVGQFDTDCAGNNHRKHGLFISYNKIGKEINRKWYFYDHPRNRKFLGLKVGWWGFYLWNYKYFLGIKVRQEIVDPCF